MSATSTFDFLLSIPVGKLTFHQIVFAVCNKVQKLAIFVEFTDAQWNCTGKGVVVDPQGDFGKQHVVRYCVYKMKHIQYAN